MSDHATNRARTPAPDRARAGDSPMIVCALLLAVFLGVVLSPMVNQTAKAEMIAESGHLVTMTAKGGNEDVLVILDNRTEHLTVYKVGQQNALELVQRLDLPELFQSARAKRLGGN
jgi:hypothetical protein